MRTSSHLTTLLSRDSERVAGEPMVCATPSSAPASDCVGSRGANVCGVARGVSIRVFLADGSPDGLWVIEKSNWTGVGLMWPRAVHASARKRSELVRPGVYVLVGPSEVSDKSRIYVGEADVLRKRLDQHHANRDFWTRAIAFTTKDANLNKAHVKASGRTPSGPREPGAARRDRQWQRPSAPCAIGGRHRRDRDVPR